VTPLELQLQALAGAIEYPATPDLAAAVTARLVEPAARRRRPPRRLVLAFAVALVALAAGVLAASPSARSAIEDLFGLKGAAVREVQTLPPSSRGAPLALGRATTLADAQRHVGFRILAPAALGQPDEVWRSTAAPGGVVTLLYRPRAGLPASKVSGVGALVVELNGRIVTQFVQKMSPTGTVRHVRVSGQPGLWVPGAHDVFYRTASGDFHYTPTRLAGNTLLWNRGDLLLRLESGLDEHGALRIASSVGG
jgi:hypothetical protein